MGRRPPGQSPGRLDEGPGNLALARSARGPRESRPIRWPRLLQLLVQVDGVRTIDPGKPRLEGITSLDNVVFVPGAAAAFEATADARHGDIRQVWYPVHARPPAPYARLHAARLRQGKGRYPVLYLLHGSGDNDSGWGTIGRAGFIVDNLLAAGKARPLVVVMPNGSMPRPANFPVTAPGTGPPLRRLRRARR